jgi:hypothetical protein
MISEKQLEANRRNAQNSTGPKSPEGKSNSSRNNLRHGLTGHISLLPTEDREAHDAFCKELIEDFHPGTAVERQLAQSIAEDFWRLNRVPAMENNIFALGHTNERSEIRIALANARTFLTQANQFSLLTIYEQRINRNVQRNLKLLRELQAERKAQRQEVVEPAVEEARAAAATPLPINKNGFVFSNAKISRAIGQDNHLKAAKSAETTTADQQTTIARAA